MAGEVTVFGSVNLDLIAQVPHLPAPGETVTGGTFFSAPGGKGANQALAAARAGAAASLVGAVGEDAFADQALSLLREEEVDLTGLYRLPQPTGTALILVDEAGENVIAVASGANYALTAEALANLPPPADGLVLSQLEMDLEATAAYLAKAKEAGCKVVLNLAPFRPEAADLLAEANLLIMNEGEALALARVLDLTERPAEELCPAVSEQTSTDVVITLGAKGMVAQVNGQVLHLPAYRVDVLDSVGAGDAFCGYLAQAMAESGSLDADALRFASAAGALTCTRPGAQTAIPLRTEVEELLEQHRLLP